MMAKLQLFIIIFLTSCNEKPNDKTIYKIHKIDSISKVKKEVVIFKKDTLTINNQKLIQISTTINNEFRCLTNLSSDTIIKFENYYFRAEFLDIDNDTYKDIRVFHFSNTPNTCDNYLFDKKTQTYKLIKNTYDDIKLIKGTKLFYSYNRAGCADYKWESYLSKIVNFELIPIGYIYGNGCGSNTNQQVIEIYKINPNNQFKTLIQKLPYQKNIPVFDKKWSFIEKYWSKNYLKFK